MAAETSQLPVPSPRLRGGLSSSLLRPFPGLSSFHPGAAPKAARRPQKQTLSARNGYPVALGRRRPVYFYFTRSEGTRLTPDPPRSQGWMAGALAKWLRPGYTRRGGIAEEQGRASRAADFLQLSGTHPAPKRERERGVPRSPRPVSPTPFPPPFPPRNSRQVGDLKCRRLS